MPDTLFYSTVTPLLLKVLKQLMSAKEFAAFRLVGGTGLSLQIGHRESIDIDLFTDRDYGSVNFEAIDKLLRKKYKYVDTNDYKEVGMGRSYFVGDGKNECVKLDIFYTDKFIRPFVNTGGIRIADIEEIIAMKLEVIGRGGRKKDFWDLHELLPLYSFKRMFVLYKERYPFSHEAKGIKKQFTEFSGADEDPDPICLRGKYWEIIKLDMLDFVKG